MEIRDTIKRALSGALEKNNISLAPELVPLEFPSELKNGDYSSGVALKEAKAAAMNPHSLAEKIVADMGVIDGVAKIDIAGPGFINLYLDPTALSKSLTQAVDTDMWGNGAFLSGKKIIIDYTQPNPFKPFHIGHLMSNATGEALSRLLEFSGATLIRVNYQGDVGLHIGKAIWGLKKLCIHPSDAQKIGEAYAYGAKAYETEEQAKQEIIAINKQVYDKSDPGVNELYQVGRKSSLEHFEDLYKILGTKFDDYFFESQVWERGLEIVRSHMGDVFEESDGAVIFPGEKYGLNTRVFITSAGLPTYEGKEMGLIDKKFKKYSPDVSIVTTAVEQQNFFAVTTKAAECIDPSKIGKLRHVAHGMMRLETGKMSSRTGDVITGESLLEDLIEQAKTRASQSRADDHEKLAQDVAVAAIKYQILKQGSGKDITFDRERALSLEGDSGPYLQYAHARARQILEKAKAEGITANIDKSVVSGELSQLLHRFPEIVERAAVLYEPHVLATYLTQLASSFNSWYAIEQILDGTPAASHKVALVAAFARTLKNGLWILGIPAPEKM